MIPAGQLKETDFTWSENQYKLPLATVKINLLEGFRRCGHRVNSINIGLDKCFDKSANQLFCDIYAGPDSGGIGGIVLGRIIITETNGTSKMQAGVYSMFDSTLGSEKGATRNAWLNLAEANYTVCKPLINSNKADDDFD